MRISKAQYVFALFALFGCSPSLPDSADSADEAAEESSAEEESPEPDAGTPECNSAGDDGDGRRGLTDVKCVEGVCTALWSGTEEARSVVVPLKELEGFEEDASIATGEWPCNPTPDLDTCFVLDKDGHLLCGRIECDYIVAVWPLCSVATPGAPTWVGVGNDMLAQTVGN